jgi:hydroxymethylglutaryl-CoA lyase
LSILYFIATNNKKWETTRVDMRDIRICEVGPRDGLQLVRQVMPTAAKRMWVEALGRCGFPEIDATSFVPPQAFPQFADAAEMVPAAIAADAGWRVGALVPNAKGAERAIAAGAQMLYCIVSASHAHSLANTRRTREEQADIVGGIVERARAAAGTGPHVMGGIPTAFGCSIEGRVAEADVCRVAEALVARGVDEIGLADTVGYADPALVRSLVKVVRGAIGVDVPIRLHFHDTMGLGLANVLAGIEAGVTTFDAASGGLGGCPFAPGASGNVATEDLVFMLEQMGLRTGVDLERLLAATEMLAEALPDERIRSHVREAGLPKIYRAAA